MSNSELIREAFQAFENIGSTASRLAKEAYVEEQRDNDFFKELVLRTYNPFKMYYVKKFKVPEAEETRSMVLNYSSFLELTNRLSTRTLSGHAALAEIESVFRAMTEVEQKWYARILQKDLKIGMTSGTVNRVHAKLNTTFKIPEFSCALAETYKPKKIPQLFAIEPKLDGYRCLAFRYPTHVELRSRNGKPIEGYASIEQAMMAFKPGHVYDGEIMSLSGTFSEMQKYAGRKDIEDKPGIFNIFDMVKIEEFFGNTEDRVPYIQRRAGLEKTFDESSGYENKALALVPVCVYASTIPSVKEQKEGMTEAEGKVKAEELIMQVHQEMLAKGYEGSMLKDADGFYECKRSWNIQKVKDMDTLDLMVIGVEPGVKGTKYENTLGSLVVEYKGYPVNVGSGFSDEQRTTIWNNKEDIINRIIEVKYFEETKDKKGKVSLRFPIFIQIRYDKD